MGFKCSRNSAAMAISRWSVGDEPYGPVFVTDANADLHEMIHRVVPGGLRRTNARDRAPPGVDPLLVELEPDEAIVQVEALQRLLSQELVHAEDLRGVRLVESGAADASDVPALERLPQTLCAQALRVAWNQKVGEVWASADLDSV